MADDPSATTFRWLGAPDGTLVPVLLLALGLTAWTLLWWRGARDRLPEDERSPWRPVGLLAAILLLTATLAGPLEHLGEQRSFAAHMVQHLFVVFAVPSLLLLSLPPSTLHRLEGTVALRWLRRPIAPFLTGGVGIVVIWAIHVPALLDGALRTPPLTDLAHLGLVVVGVLLIWPLAGPTRMRGFPGLAYLAVTELLVGVLGLLLLWHPAEFYDAFTDTRLFGVDARSDQALAGAILLVAAEPFLAVEVALVFMRALRDGDEDTDEPDPEPAPDPDDWTERERRAADAHVLRSPGAPPRGDPPAPSP